MARLEDRLHDELERAARPPDVSGVYEQLIERRRRRRTRRTLEVAMLAVVVVAGSLGGVIALSRVFGSGDGHHPIGSLVSGPFENGALAYTDGQSIVIVETDGTKRTVPSPSDGMAWHIAWSPDGQHIAVAMFADPGRSLWIMRSDGSDAIEIADADNVGRPSWTSDGSRLTYTLERSGRTEVHVANADGSDDRAVLGQDAPGTYAVSSSTFSPDGTQILFDAGTDSGYDIFVMRSDGSDVRQITHTAHDYNPSWSPDGTRIVFTRQEAASESDIFVMDADGTHVQRLTEDGPRFTNLNAEYSPDGSKITYEHAETGGVGPIIVMNTDGTDPMVIVDAQVLGFSWQPIASREITTSPSPESVQEDIGLGYPVCDVSAVPGHFASQGPQGVAFVATRAGDLGCPTGSDAPPILAVDIDGDGLSDTSIDLPNCQGRCWAFAAPDVDADGVDEVAVGTGSTGGSTLFELYAVAGESLLRLGYDCSRCNDGVFSWGRPGGHAEGAYCLPAGEVANFVFWSAEQTDAGDQYAVAKIFIDVKGGFLTQVDRQDAFVPFDVVSLPPGGGSDFCGSPVSVDPGEIAPIPSPGVSAGGADIGLGFPVCNVSSRDGTFFGDGRHQTAYVATRLNDTGDCPEPGTGYDVVAVDLAGDDSVDVSLGPIGCELVCRVFSAPDVDGDGTSEVLVAQAGGSVLGLGLYDVVGSGDPGADGVALVRVGVAEPGDPAGGFRPGRPALLWLGGDGFTLDTLRCGTVPAPDAPEVVATSAESLPHDVVDAVWHAHEVTLSLGGDGDLHVLSTRDFTEPVSSGSEGPSFGSGETLCGSNLGP